MNVKKWVVQYADIVISKDIPALDSAIKARIKEAIETKLTHHPIHFGKPLRHSPSNVKSLRVGKYRILYIIDNSNKIVLIAAIGHRQEIYKRVE